ncbi:MAG: single-stranded DNA-binding protein, partial [Bacteroidales bacterium]|nr:single-stranded DNA-binding protein [Bacteroidales bacterium]
INKVILIGNLGKDPDIMTFENGVKRANIAVATNENYKDKEGNWVEQTEWHNVVGWRWLAEKNLVKGDMVYIEGKLKTRTWDDKDGVKHYITEVVADKITRITPRQEQGTYQAPPPVATTENFQEPPPEEGPTDDLPF